MLQQLTVQTIHTGIINPHFVNCFVQAQLILETIPPESVPLPALLDLNREIPRLASKLAHRKITQVILSSVIQCQVIVNNHAQVELLGTQTIKQTDSVDRHVQRLQCKVMD